MQDIQILEKPASVSDDELWQIVYASHAENRKNGLKINSLISDGKGMREHLGSDAVTWIAVADGVTAGTVSARLQPGKKPLQGRQVVYMMHLGVLPGFGGRGIGKALCAKVIEFARQQGAGAVTLHVVYRNPALKFYRHQGFEELDFIARSRLKQNSVYMVYWTGKPALSPRWQHLRYRLRKKYTELRYRFN